jgi:hypothetical protein
MIPSSTQFNMIPRTTLKWFYAVDMLFDILYGFLVRDTLEPPIFTASTASELYLLHDPSPSSISTTIIYHRKSKRPNFRRKMSAYPSKRRIGTFGKEENGWYYSNSTYSSIDSYKS